MPGSADGFFRLSSSPDDTCGRREKPDKKRALEVRLVREVQVLNLKFIFGGVFEKASRHTVFANACMKAKARGTDWTQSCRDPKNRLSGHGGNAVMVQGTRSRDPLLNESMI